jgi:hypothetical protein
MKKVILLNVYQIVFLSISAVLLAGCLEASFELAPESRLPKWFDAPEGVARSDLKVTMDYHSTFDGGEYIFKLYDKKKILKLQKITLTTEEQPTIRTKELSNPPTGFPVGYPAYNVVTVNGITDIVERRRMEPVFYMTDDPAIWKELGLEE